MKKIYLVFTVFSMVFNLLFAQSISFVNPSNAEVLSGSWSQTTIPVNLNYSTRNSEYPPGYVIADKVKLSTGTNTYWDSYDENIPQWFYLTPGTYTWTLELWELFLGGNSFIKTATKTITFYVRHTITVRNNFTISASTIKIDNLIKTSGTKVLKSPGDNLTLGAIEQTYDGKFYIWQTEGSEKSKWEITKYNSSTSNMSFNKNHTYFVQTNDNMSVIVANLKVHQVPNTPSISMSGNWGDNPTLTFYGGGNNVDHYVLKKEYDFGSGYGNPSYVNITGNSYTDPNVEIRKFGGDLTARYSVKAVDVWNYESNYSSTVSTNGQSLWKNGSTQEEIINEYALNSNYPNPFNPTTQISYQIPEDGQVNLTIYNSLGEEISNLVNNYQASGKYNVQFDASNLPSGVYIYRLSSGNFTATKKMLLTK